VENILSEYQKWKQQGEALRAQAKQAMESRFHELLAEAAQIARDYQADFGVSLKPPADVTEFRFKAGAGAGKSPARAKSGKTPEPAAPAAPAPPNPGIPALEKKLAAARAKVDAAKAAGKPSRNLEDKVYEIEDELRLARGV